MSNTKSKIPFQGTPEQEAQDIYGYLPIEVQEIIAKQLDMPLEEVYGVVTFYSQFSLNPKGQYKISVCLGTACYVKGAGDIYDRLSKTLGIKGGECTPDGKFSLEACRCIGACGLAPTTWTTCWRNTARNKPCRNCL